VASERDRVFEQLLALRCRSGDQDAWRDLLRRWEIPLFYYQRRLLDQEADAWDVLQQTWLAAYRGIASLKDPQHLVVWLHRIARNLAISHRRLNRHEFEPLPQESQSIGAADDDSPDAQTEAFEDADQVHAAMDRLSLPHREVLTLFFLQDLSIEQIATVVDASVGTIKSRLHYAKRALRQAIEQPAQPREGQP
jgi:RNA polymerase sigma-70 factor (ECF subfamily)